MRTKKEIREASRRELIDHLENHRGMACYDEESTDFLRETALEDLPTYREELGLTTG